MISSYSGLPDLVIPNGTNVSQVLNSPYVFGDALALALYGTDGAYPETYTFEANEDQAATNASTGWMTVQGSTGVDLALPGVGKMRIYQELVYSGSLRLKSNINVAATRTWKVNKVWST